MNFVEETISFLSFLSSDSLFSSVFALYTLLFLYLPFILFSPVVLATLILLLYLLRLGASQDSDNNEGNDSESESDLDWSCLQIQGFDDHGDGSGLQPRRRDDMEQFCSESFVEWDVRAPLEVIYEAYEGEDADDQANDGASLRRESEVDAIRRYASLSLFYPESDGDSSSEGDFTADGGWEWSPESACCRWEDEEEDDDDDREGLIEIALDEKRNNGDGDEEENLIEIDLSPSSDVDFRQPNRDFL